MRRVRSRSPANYRPPRQECVQARRSYRSIIYFCEAEMNATRSSMSDAESVEPKFVGMTPSG